MPHFGLAMALAQWKAMAAQFEAADSEIVLRPQVRIQSEPCEQWTKFFRVPSGNPIGFKGYRSLASVYDR